MLMKRRYKIISSDKKNGVIHAQSKFRLFRPSFDIHVQSMEMDINQTKLTVDFIPKNTNKRSSIIQEIEEARFLEMVNHYL